jgi:hypothetical protein
MGHPILRPSGAVSSQTAAKERHPLRYIAILDRDPASQDGSLGAPVGEILLGRYRDQLVYPLAEDCVISDERKEDGAYIDQAAAKDGG